MLRKGAIILSLTVGLLGSPLVISVEDNIKSLRSFTDKQKGILIQSYLYAERDDLGLTMSAIAWHESNAGKNLVNLGDPSFGIYHNLVGSVINRLGLPNTLYYRNKIANRLVQDPNFARSQALSELLYWKSHYLRTSGKRLLWQKTIRSYNGGTMWRNKDTEIYFNNIRNKIKALRKAPFFKNFLRGRGVK